MGNRRHVGGWAKPSLPVEGQESRSSKGERRRAARGGKLVRRLGFEPRTNWLKANCSTN